MLQGNRAKLLYNPALRELVADKRKWSKATVQAGKQRFSSWNERGFLPHRDEPGLTQFVTFRVADSFPSALRSEWEGMLKVEDAVEKRRLLENYLDKGRGECLLRRAEFATIIENSVRFFHGERYELDSWVVMPNHVHVLFTPKDHPMSQIIESWKKFTAHEVNRRTERNGKLWFNDYWDTYMRDERHVLRTRRYIEANPVKAFLVREAKDWPWSSARFRDTFGRLVF